MPPHDLRAARGLYRFLPLERAHYSRLRRWLGEPHVRPWWGDPEAEIALMEEEIETGPTQMYLVAEPGGEPFGYVQDYPAHHWPMLHYAAFPEGTRGMDTFIGDPACLGQGHAARYLRQRAAELIAAGAPAVVTDPAPENTRSVRAWRAAGFEGDTVVPCEDGSAVLLLSFEGRHLPRAELRAGASASVNGR